MKEKNVLIEDLELPFPRLGEEKAGEDTKKKVRTMYDVGYSGTTPLILMVTTDRISAFDVVMLNGIPGKGEVLTRDSAFWFRKTRRVCPNHFYTDNFNEFPEEIRKQLEPWRNILENRSMLVLKKEAILIEGIVRSRLLGSAWKSYKKTGQVCGIVLPKGLNKGDKLPAPIYTPSTKAALGEHDENITFEKTIEILGDHVAQQVRAQSLSLYSWMANISYTLGLELTDTKYEFALTSSRRVEQIDESGTPDSSRYDPDYSKQPVRDWLESLEGWDKETPIELPEDIVKKTSKNYIKGCEMLTGYKVEI